MSLARSGSRAITVDDIAYRWALSPDSGYDVIVVQAATGVGAKLRVYVSYLQVVYADADDQGRLAVTPGLVTLIIRQACEHGWQPGETGLDTTCDLQADGAIVVRATS